MNLENSIAYLEPTKPVEGRSFRFFPCRFIHENHYHPDFEITYISKGEGKRKIGENIEKFSAGDLVMVGSNVEHHWKMFPSYQPKKGGEKPSGRVILFKWNSWGEPFFTKLEFKAVNELFKEAGRGVFFWENAAKRIGALMKQMSKMDDHDQFIALQTILSIMRKTKKKRLLNKKDCGLRKHFGNETLNTIAQFIEGNLENSDLKEAVSAEFQHSIYRLDEMFQKYAGKTFKQYIKRFRINKAKELLLTTEKEIKIIAKKCGFRPATFSRDFKSYTKQTPNSYRSYGRNYMNQVL